MEVVVLLPCGSKRTLYEQEKGYLSGYNITLRQAAMRQWADYDTYTLNVSWDTPFSNVRGDLRGFDRKLHNTCIII